MPRLHAAQGAWLDLLPMPPSREIRHLLEDLEAGRLEAYRGRRQIMVWEPCGSSFWVRYNVKPRATRKLGVWTRCRILENLLSVLNFDAVTTYPRRERPVRLEVVR